MSKYAQGIFVPKYPEKYVGRGSIKYRSSWEFAFMQMCDNHPSIINWASESVRIPYQNPLTGKNTFYVPDFFIVYQDKNGQNHAEVIEVKPSKEMAFENARSQRDKLAVIVNYAKWTAAAAWAKNNGIKFRVVSENDIFHQGKPKK
jgi:hypothetical protein